jgi:hypothetical protein
MALWLGVVLLLIAAYPLASCIDAWITDVETIELPYILFSLGTGGKPLFSIGDIDVNYSLASFYIGRTLLLTITLILIFIGIGLLVSEKKTLRIVR